ncbi:hypothetical protein [Nakamurella aerolata]|uniref:hypothetical protein n=1 Tax=Nakamurella aerolata TaxID=1656892 RepID=UPI001BB1A310|nr:hypothetical protein [Nakamurella aerolata]
MRPRARSEPQLSAPPTEPTPRPSDPPQKRPVLRLELKTGSTHTSPIHQTLHQRPISDRTRRKTNTAATDDEQGASTPPGHPTLSRDFQHHQQNRHPGRPIHHENAQFCGWS